LFITYLFLPQGPTDPPSCLTELLAQFEARLEERMKASMHQQFHDTLAAVREIIKK
jgi:hypothetical protein